MKKTQVLEITKALAAGEKLTALDCFKLCGSLRMSAHAFIIERNYGIELVKKSIKGKTRYGNTMNYTEYSMNPKDAKMVTKLLNKKQK